MRSVVPISQFTRAAALSAAMLLLLQCELVFAGAASDVNWRNCQSSDPDRRIMGCSKIIDQAANGSNSKLADALDGRCWAYHVKGQYQLAIADCKRSISIRPNYSFAYNNLGTAYLGIGDAANALAALNSAVELKPKFFWSRLNRGKAFVALGRKDEALKDFETALALDPKSEEARVASIELKDNPSGRNSQTTPPLVAAVAPPPQTSSPTQATSVFVPDQNVMINPGRRIALVIGNAAYNNVPILANPQHDATLVANALRRVGFDSVVLQTDLGRDAMIGALRAFAQQAENADWSVVYYSGHGMEVGGVNYLIPTDAKIAADRDIGFEAVALEQVLNAAERAKRLRLVVLDACRDNPFASQMKRTLGAASRSVSRGLASVEPEAGTLVVYAAKDGETALDGEGADSPFALAFVKNLQTPGVEVRRMFDFVRDDVMDATQRRQKPFSYGSISGRQDFYFVANK
jgi:tetratricopeptide (TPR) repeat protein